MRVLLAAALAFCASFAHAQGIGIGFGPGPGMTGAPPGFPVVAATNFGTETTSNTTAVVNLPSGINSGDLLLFFGAFSNTYTSPSTPAGWTKRDDTTVLFYYKIADGTEGSTVNVSWTNSVTSRWYAVRITGANGHLPEFGTLATGTSINPDPPNLTPSWGALNTLWIVAAKLAAATTVSSWSTGFSNNQYSSTASGPRLILATQNLNASSNNPSTLTLSGSDSWRVQTIGVRP